MIPTHTQYRTLFERSSMYGVSCACIQMSFAVPVSALRAKDNKEALCLARHVGSVPVQASPALFRALAGRDRGLPSRCGSLKRFLPSSLAQFGRHSASKVKPKAEHKRLRLTSLRTAVVCLSCLRRPGNVFVVLTVWVDRANIARSSILGGRRRVGRDTHFKFSCYYPADSDCGNTNQTCPHLRNIPTIFMTSSS